MQQESTAGYLGIFILNPTAIRAGGTFFSHLNLHFQSGSALGAKGVGIVVVQTTAGG